MSNIKRCTAVLRVLALTVDYGKLLRPAARSALAARRRMKFRSIG